MRVNVMRLWWLLSDCGGCLGIVVVAFGDATIAVLVLHLSVDKNKIAHTYRLEFTRRRYCLYNNNVINRKQVNLCNAIFD